MHEVGKYIARQMLNLFVVFLVSVDLTRCFHSLCVLICVYIFVYLFVVVVVVVVIFIVVVFVVVFVVVAVAVVVVADGTAIKALVIVT